MQWLPSPKLTIITLLVGGGIFFLTPDSAYAYSLAQFGEDVRNFFVDTAGALTDATLGSVLVGILQMFKAALAFTLALVAQLFEVGLTFDNFFTEGVNTAWRATRDFANLFFSFILLFIAIATALNIQVLQKYNAKNLLPKFIVIALLLNFSRAIVGLVVDISQLFMFQFYNAAIGDSATMFSRFSRYTNISDMAIGDNVSNMQQSLAYLSMIVLLALLISVLVWSTAILLTRVVVIWVIIVLSPMAFIAALIPPLQQYWNQWKEALQKQAVNGPIILFFVWIALTVLQGVGEG
ncbi:MAG: hypothetical protein BRC24_01130, partial [Parcubacteria group bacterium SW_4_46_8]